MEIQKVRVEVMRDALCKVPKEVGAHEVAVLQAVHGDAAVTVTDEDVGTVTVTDVGEEYSRLAQLYGVDNERRQSHVEIAYGRNTGQLASALRAATVKKPAPTGGKKTAASPDGGDGEGGSATDPT